MSKEVYYALSDKVSIRKEKEGIVLIVGKNKEDYTFIYVSDSYDIFLRMSEYNSYLTFTPFSNKNSIEEVSFLSAMIKDGVFVYSPVKLKAVATKNIVLMKRVPKMTYLFITPTMHFRRRY